MIKLTSSSLNPSFGIRISTQNIPYAKNHFINKEYGKIKGYDVFVSKNFSNNKLTSRLICIKDKFNNLIKGKIKYLEDGTWKNLNIKV